MEFFGPLIGGIVSGLGSMFGSSQNAAAQEQINQQNIAMQEAFAQNGISWKVADAKRAGINPLAALGASTSSFSNLVAPTPGTGLADAGQNIARAMQTMRSPEDKAAAAMKTQLDMESKSLDNDIKRAELASAMKTTFQPGNSPGLPHMFTTYLDDEGRPHRLPTEAAARAIGAMGAAGQVEALGSRGRLGGTSSTRTGWEPWSAGSWWNSFKQNHPGIFPQYSE